LNSIEILFEYQEKKTIMNVNDIMENCQSLMFYS